MFWVCPNLGSWVFPLHLAGTVGNEGILRSNDIFIILLFFFPLILVGVPVQYLPCLVGLFFNKTCSRHKNWSRYPFYLPRTNPCQMQIFQCWSFFTEHDMVFLVHTFWTLNTHVQKWNMYQHLLYGRYRSHQLLIFKPQSILKCLVLIIARL